MLSYWWLTGPLRATVGSDSGKEAVDWEEWCSMASSGCKQQKPLPFRI